MKSPMTIGALFVLALACSPESTLDDGLDSGGSGGSAGLAGSGGAAANEAGADAGATGGSSNAGSGGAAAGTAPTSGSGGSSNPNECPGERSLSDGSDLNEEAWPSDAHCAPGPMPPPAPTSLSVAPLAGTWIDDSLEPRIELVLDATGAGTLLYDEFAELPPLTDPSEAYLIDVGANDMPAFDRVNMQLQTRQPMYGFRYSVSPDRGAGSEMSFFINTSEPWGEWCALQEPVRGGNCYQCEFVGDGGTMFMRDACSVPDGCYAVVANELLPIHCGRALLCELTQICSCNENECFANSEMSRKGLTATLDPVDTGVLRLVGETGESRYLLRQP